ncbi:MAG: hypothetical protein Q9162_000660 [Coniocarpon cinnabarinum]
MMIQVSQTLKGWRVVAIDREIEDSIKSLGCTYMQVDVSSTMSINAFKDEHFAHSEPIDLLLNVAGVMAPKEHDTLQTVSAETLERTFRVNTFGPLLLTQALLPNVLCSKAQPPRIAVMSSRVGSIADNSSGGSYAYRASKTAVNSFFKSMAIELKEKGIPVTILHPGIVQTGLNPLDTVLPPEAVQPEEAATKLWKVLQDKGVKLENSGTFWHREGFELPW